MCLAVELSSWCVCQTSSTWMRQSPEFVGDKVAARSFWVSGPASSLVSSQRQTASVLLAWAASFGKVRGLPPNLHTSWCSKPCQECDWRWRDACRWAWDLCHGKGGSRTWHCRTNGVSWKLTLPWPQEFEQFQILSMSIISVWQLVLPHLEFLELTLNWHTLWCRRPSQVEHRWHFALPDWRALWDTAGLRCHGAVGVHCERCQSGCVQAQETLPCWACLAVWQVEHRRSFAHRQPDCCALWDTSGPHCHGAVGFLVLLHYARPRSRFSGSKEKNLASPLATFQGKNVRPREKPEGTCLWQCLYSPTWRRWISAADHRQWHFFVAWPHCCRGLLLSSLTAIRVGETHEKKTDLETQMATRSSKLEIVVFKSCVLDCWLILDSVRTATEDGEIHAGEREIFATTKEDLEHGIAGQMECLGSCRFLYPKSLT